MRNELENTKEFYDYIIIGSAYEERLIEDEYFNDFVAEDLDRGLSLDDKIYHIKKSMPDILYVGDQKITEDNFFDKFIKDNNINMYFLSF